MNLIKRLKFNSINCKFINKNSFSASYSSSAILNEVRKLEHGDRNVITQSELNEVIGNTHGVASMRNVSFDPDLELADAAYNNSNNSSHTEIVSDEDMDKFQRNTQNYPKGYGVFREIEDDDINVLLDSFTAPALATGLRQREQTLQICARLLKEEKISELKEVLNPFTKSNVMKRRNKKRPLDLSTSFSRNDLVILQRYLHRMPRQVAQARERRASVVLPLCNDNGVASILFQKRNPNLRKHGGEICFPGGMVDEDIDSTIIQTSLRETSEELGIPRDVIDVLGILRCNWSEVEHMTGIAVTPVIGFLGELNDITLHPNPDEVQAYFTIPVVKLMNQEKWVIKPGVSPVFTGGPYIIWGLTGYLLRAFITEVIEKTDPIK